MLCVETVKFQVFYKPKGKTAPNSWKQQILPKLLLMFCQNQIMLIIGDSH